MNAKCFLLMAVWAGLGGAVPPIFAQTWIPAATAPLTNWSSIASSADGTRLVAAAGLITAQPVWNINNPAAPIYVSTNGGATWTNTTAPLSTWQSVACSADGSRLAAVSAQGWVYTSSDGGGAWASNNLPTGITWSAVTSSADGTKLAIAGSGSGIYISANGGTNWSPSDAPATNWTGLASSADGSRMVAVQAGDYLHFNGSIYTSTNAGTNWWLTTAPAAEWFSVASSADGSRLAATAFHINSLGPGPIYLSTNAGLTWAPSGAPPEYWNSIASSADGSKLVAAGNGALYTSADFGATWAASSVPYLYWRCATSSADGSKLAVLASQIYTAASPPTPWLNPTLTGGGLVLSWTLPSTNLVLQQNSDLASANWRDVAAIATLTTTTLQYQVTLPLTNRQGFYRLQSR
jgi:photosystem II stability/assembly factor-like uncharacterized protein